MANKRKKKKGGHAECKWEDSAFHELSLAFERTHRSKKDFFREKIYIYIHKNNKNNNNNNKKQTKKWGTGAVQDKPFDELLMFIADKDSALFSGLWKREVARPSDSVMFELLFQFVCHLEDIRSSESKLPKQFQIIKFV